MFCFPKHLYLVMFSVVIILLMISGSFEEDIIGCGGFVKSDIDISKAQVQVKLYTKHGSLKDHTECAPKNGYYFIPMYDKGEYVLKIEPPKGWTFEPREVPLSFDGTSDPCSQNKDINFQFKGFTVYGNVLSTGSSSGPEGVTVKLLKDKKEVAETVSDKGGNFEFPSVAPGEYVVQASHPRWKLSSSGGSVTVAGGNGRVKVGSLVVSGYDVSGKVVSEGDPMRDVNFVLFQLDVKPGAAPLSVPGCLSQPLTGFKPSGPVDKTTRQVCYVVSDGEGHFLFSELPPGRYRIEPHYQGSQSLRFDLAPKSQEFTVTHNSIVLPTNFQIKGFTVSGKVLYSPGGRGVPHAYVLLNNQIKAETDKNGFYQLDAVQTGNYALEAASDKLRFSPVDVRISPSMPHLPDLTPWGFEVCGRITPPRLDDDRPRTVILSSDREGNIITNQAEADSAGLYCFFLKPGTYYASVKMSREENAKGLQYAPLSREVKVVDRPLHEGLDFSQLKARVHGHVTCINKCSDISIQLVPLSGGSVQTTTLKSDGSYELVEVLLGGYRVTVVREDWCWEMPHQDMEVATADVLVPVLKQSGFALKIVSSHDTSVSYELVSEQPKNQPTVKNVWSVKKGMSTVCVPVSGTYHLQTVGCHQYDSGVFTWNTETSSKQLLLNAVGHTVTAWLESDNQVDDIIVHVERLDGTLLQKQGPLASKREGSKWRYEVKVIAREGEDYKLVPHSSLMLFNPKEVMLQRHTDCANGVAKIEAYLGHVISGEVVPPLPGVAVTVSDDSLSSQAGSVIARTQTNEKGQYRIGPLQPGHKYSVKAGKEGYVMSGPDDKNRITARKLAEVVAVVTDRADGAPLQGVLLSLSGGSNYRRNSQTGADGKLSFKSLSPGEYYLRPMLKEYRFDPPSLQFEVKEGEAVNVKLSGDRVAVSAFGIVTSLSKEPEPGVLVEAVGVDREGHKCSHLQEEAITENNGQFRIRGLQPQCNYIVRVKPGAEDNKHIYRATPESIPLQAVDSDVTNLKLVAFRPITKTDVVALVRPSPSSAEHLPTLRLRLCREEAPDSPLHVVRLDSIVGSSGPKAAANHPAGVLVHFPPVPADGLGYYVYLESTLSSSGFDYKSYGAHFRANVSFRHVALTFDAKPRFVDQDMNQGSILLLPVVIAMLVFYFNQDRAIPFFKELLQDGISLRRSGSDVSGQSERSSTRDRGGARDRGNNRERDITPDESDGAMVEPVAGKKKMKPRRA